MPDKYAAKRLDKHDDDLSKMSQQIADLTKRVEYLESRAVPNMSSPSLGDGRPWPDPHAVVEDED